MFSVEIICLSLKGKDKLFPWKHDCVVFNLFNNFTHFGHHDSIETIKFCLFWPSLLWFYKLIVSEHCSKSLKFNNTHSLIW